MARSAFAPARSSSAIAKSASARLGLAIQHDALIQRVPKHTGVQVRLSPCVDRAWNDVASKSASRHGPVDLVVIQRPPGRTRCCNHLSWSAAEPVPSPASRHSPSDRVYRTRYLLA
jgi:hypothetical protein